MRNLVYLIAYALFTIAITAGPFTDKSWPGEVNKPLGPVVLTIGGNVANWNHGPVDPIDDGFMKYHDIEFDKAMQLDRPMIAELPFRTVKARLPNSTKTSVFEGPRLVDILKLAGVSNATVTLMALDGYAVELTPDNLTGKDWILSLTRDSEPLGLGGRGPFWLVHTPASGEQASTEEEEKWVWSVFYIHAK